MSDDEPVTDGEFSPADESSTGDELTLDADSIDGNASATRRQPVPCPRRDAPVALVVSDGPAVHEASPCGCLVPGSLLEGRETSTE
ncbi:hypothetical protein [Natrinema salaciae]|uniref:Uncharacterized protein n=1 Tax=Natrinema salaciae TaxID=1186196 RepID=A0A1H9JA63_9EURY|nr:hypothetical protein [Natrinema salaciae]SEQ83750.1 hypothetical protein SAMN04489841_2485 [Natrinema salaciae]